MQNQIWNMDKKMFLRLLIYENIFYFFFLAVTWSNRKTNSFFWLQTDKIAEQKL